MINIIYFSIKMSIGIFIKVTVDRIIKSAMMFNMKIATVIVIELVGGIVQSATSFTDDESGNKDAEAHFARLLKEYNDEPDDVIQQCTEDGHYEAGMGYEVVLCHSQMQFETADVKPPAP